MNVARFYAAIPGSQSIGNGMYTVPCASIATTPISITIGGRAFTISPTLFNQGVVSVGSTQCVGGVAAAPQTKPPIRYWTLGDVFLQNVYSIYDMGANQVGFATPT